MRQHPVPRLTRTLWSTLTLTLACAACAPDDPGGPAGPDTERVRISADLACGGTKPGGSAEGEIYGNFFEDGAPVCNTQYYVSLQPIGFTIPNFTAGLWSDPGYAQDWEFWDPAGGGPCENSGGLSAFNSSGANIITERIHDSGNSGYEHHCVRPGSYTFDDSHRASFVVDYLQPSGNVSQSAYPGLYWASVETQSVDRSAAPFVDLVIATDVGTTTYSDTPAIDIQNAGSTPGSGAFANQANPSGTAEDWFRFGVSGSTTTWTQGGELYKLYFDVNNNLSDATNYYTATPEGFPFLRIHRFPNPVADSAIYTVGLEIMRPDEGPAGSPSGSTRTVTIYRIKPDLQGSAVSAGAASGYATVRGASIDVAVSEYNAATSSYAVAETGWYGKVYLSSDTVLSPSTDTLIYSYQKSGTLGPTASANHNGTGSVPAGTDAGTYYVLYAIDATGAVSESSESNNVTVGANQVAVHASLAAPTTLGATSVGSTTATVTWDNGPAFGGFTTTIEARIGAGSWNVVASGISAASESQGLTGLTSNTTYDIRIRHAFNGVTSSWTTEDDLFTTEEGTPPTITSFDIIQCNREYSASKWRITWQLGWSISGSASGTTWEIEDGNGVPIASGSSGTSTWTGEYLEYQGPTYVDFYLRYNLGGSSTSWYALSSNTFDATSCMAEREQEEDSLDTLRGLWQVGPWP